MSNKTKQTPTMWLTMKLGDLEMLRYNAGMDVIEYLKAKTKVLEQAKEMEKKQAQRTFEESRLTNAFVGFKHKTFEDYYNETYGGNK
jgi:hypothetical protein